MVPNLKSLPDALYCISNMAPKAASTASGNGPRTARRWVVRYDDPNWVVPAAGGLLRGVISQPEIGDEAKRYHTQAYVECVGIPSNKQVAGALNIPWSKKGEVREHSLHLVAAFGTRDENLAYCSSTKYCHPHSQGDIKFDFDSASLVANDSFCNCEEAKHKGQQAPPTMTGTWPAMDGSAGGRGRTYGQILEAIMAGKKWPDLLKISVPLCAQCHGWIDKMIAQFQLQPKFAKYPHEACCKSIGLHGIPFADEKWQHCAVVIGNAGIGKTQWALSHFNDKGALFVTHLDDLKAYDEMRFDGIVFDDMCFTQQPLQSQKYLLDWEDDRTIHLRYSNARIPAKTRKIFTCNWGEFPFDETNTAVMDRAFIVETDKSKVSQRGKPPPCAVYRSTSRSRSPRRNVDEYGNKPYHFKF